MGNCRVWSRSGATWVQGVWIRPVPSAAATVTRTVPAAPGSAPSMSASVRPGAICARQSKVPTISRWPGGTAGSTQAGPSHFASGVAVSRVQTTTESAVTSPSLMPLP